MEVLIATQLIETGADIALIGIAWAVWKLDRRVLKLELGRIVDHD